MTIQAILHFVEDSIHFSAGVARWERVEQETTRYFSTLCQKARVPANSVAIFPLELLQAESA